MKIFVGTILAILIFAGTSCQMAVDVEKEKEAILAVTNRLQVDALVHCLAVCDNVAC